MCRYQLWKWSMGWRWCWWLDFHLQMDPIQNWFFYALFHLSFVFFSSLLYSIGRKLVVHGALWPFPLFLLCCCRGAYDIACGEEYEDRENNFGDRRRKVRGDSICFGWAQKVKGMHAWPKPKLLPIPIQPPIHAFSRLPYLLPYHLSTYHPMTYEWIWGKRKGRKRNITYGFTKVNINNLERNYSNFPKCLLFVQGEDESNRKTSQILYWHNYLSPLPTSTFHLPISTYYKSPVYYITSISSYYSLQGFPLSLFQYPLLQLIYFSIWMSNCNLCLQPSPNSKSTLIFNPLNNRYMICRSNVQRNHAFYVKPYQQDEHTFHSPPEIKYVSFSLMHLLLYILIVQKLLSQILPSSLIFLYFLFHKLAHF